MHSTEAVVDLRTAFLARIMCNSTEDKKMDSFYSWIVCFVSFLAGFIVIGFYISFGSIFVALIAEFNASESSAAWVGSSSYCVLCLGLTVVNMLLPRIGYRAVSCLGSLLFGAGLLLSSIAPNLPVLFLTYGLMFGIGSSMVNFSGLFILPNFFKYKRGLAFGISLSGHGIGALPMGYLTEYLIEEFGLRMALRLLALFAVPLFAGSLVYGSTTVLGKQENLEEKPRSLVVKKSSSESVWKNKALIAHALAMSVNAFGYYIPVVHLVNMAEGLGVSSFKATLLPSAIAISQSIGKIIFGQVMTWFRDTKLNTITQMSILIAGLVTTLCPLMTDFTGLLAYTIIFGLFDACPSVTTFKIIENIAGEKNINAGYAVQLIGMSLFLLIGPPTAGFLKEITGSYRVPFVLSGGFATVCVCIMFLTPMLHKKAKQDEYSLEYARKISVISKDSIDSKCSIGSSKSSDSGINLYTEEEMSMLPSSSLSSVSYTSNDASEISDFSTEISAKNKVTYNDVELSDNIAKFNSFSKDFWLAEKELLSKCKSTIIVIDRETVL